MKHSGRGQRALYLGSTRAGGDGDSDHYVTTR